MDLKHVLSKIKLLACDFDGIMTDGTVYVNQDGVEMVQCSRKDGMGIELLKKNGIEVIVISREENPVVTARCKKLKINCVQSVMTGQKKVDILKKYMQEHNLLPNEVAYVGDDINDLPALKAAGVAITVADAPPEVKKVAHLTTEAGGGRHAIREIANRILEAKGTDSTSY